MQQPIEKQPMKIGEPDLSGLEGAHLTHWSQAEQERLLQGEILLRTWSESVWGAAVTAQMYVPLVRSRVWSQLTDYPRWIQFFPALTRSEVLSQSSQSSGKQVYKRLYQVASKAFFCFNAQVEVYLKALETAYQRVQFQLERGNFTDFSADLQLRDWGAGTLLIYSVQATPEIPIPTVFIQQGIHLELPANLRKMRQVLCLSESTPASSL